MSTFLHTKIRHSHIVRFENMGTEGPADPRGRAVIRVRAQQGFTVVLTYFLVLSLNRRDSRANTPAHPIVGCCAGLSKTFTLLIAGKKNKLCLPCYFCQKGGVFSLLIIKSDNLSMQWTPVHWRRYFCCTQFSSGAAYQMWKTVNVTGVSFEKNNVPNAGMKYLPEERMLRSFRNHRWNQWGSKGKKALWRGISNKNVWWSLFSLAGLWVASNIPALVVRSLPFKLKKMVTF